MRVVAEATAYAHGRGVIHRDLKPANILLDSAGQLHVTDFGLAKRVDGDSNLTATGQILGTPSFMPPEQAAGQIGQIKEAADVYALGAVLYTLLTGRPPFQADNPRDTLVEVLDRDPVSPRQLNRKLPRDLETICLKCLEKAPRRRYRSAAELAEELQRFLQREPIKARPIGRTARLWRWSRRNPVVSALSACLLLGFIVALVGITTQWIRAERNANIIRSQLDVILGDDESGIGIRIYAASIRWRLDRQLVLSPLVEGLQHGDRMTRSLSARTLAEAQVKPDAAIAGAVLSAITEPNELDFYEHLVRIELDEAVLPALLGILPKKHSIERDDLLMLIDSISPAQAGDVQSHIEAMSGSDPGRRIWATAYLLKANPGMTAAVPALRQALEHPHADVRCWAALVLTKIGPDAQPVIPVLRELQEDEDDRVPWRAALALEALDQQTAAPRAATRLYDWVGFGTLVIVCAAPFIAVIIVCLLRRRAVLAVVATIAVILAVALGYLASIRQFPFPIGSPMFRLRHGNHRVRAWTIDRLDQKGAHRERILRALTDALNEGLLDGAGQRSTRSSAAFRLHEVASAGRHDYGSYASMMKPAVTALIRCLSDEYGMVRKRAAEGLGEFGGYATNATPALIVALEDWSAGPEAAIALSEIGPRAAAVIPALQEASQAADPLLAAEAMLALGKIQPEKYAAENATYSYVQALKTDNWVVRRRASAALVEIGVPAIGQLIVSLSDRDHRVRQGGLQALRGIALDLHGRRERWPADDRMHAVMALFRDGNEAVRREAIEALQMICLVAAPPDNAIPAFLEALNDENLSVRVTAAGALHDIDKEAAKAAIPVLLEGLTATDRLLRANSIFVLGSLGPEAEVAVPALMRALDDSDRLIRRDAAAALSRIQPAASRDQNRNQVKQE